MSQLDVQNAKQYEEKIRECGHKLVTQWLKEAHDLLYSAEVKIGYQRFMRIDPRCVVIKNGYNVDPELTMTLENYTNTSEAALVVSGPAYVDTIDMWVDIIQHADEINRELEQAKSLTNKLKLDIGLHSFPEGMR